VVVLCHRSPLGGWCVQGLSLADIAKEIISANKIGRIARCLRGRCAILPPKKRADHRSALFRRKPFGAITCPYAHSTHAATAAARVHALLPWRLGDHDFRREQQARDRGGVLQSRRVTWWDPECPFRSYRRTRRTLRCSRTCPCPRGPGSERPGIFTRIGDDLAQALRSSGPGFDARGLIFVLATSFSMAFNARTGDAAARDHAFFDGRTGRVQCVFDAGLLSFISISVAAPTLITATPPESLATRSCSFSLS